MRFIRKARVRCNAQVLWLLAEPVLTIAAAASRLRSLAAQELLRSTGPLTFTALETPKPSSGARPVHRSRGQRAYPQDTNWSPPVVWVLLRSMVQSNRGHVSW